MGLPDNRQPFFISSASFSFHSTETWERIAIFGKIITTQNRHAMPRISKIKYDPSLTLQENADKNGVKLDAIRYFIKTRGIDREGDRQAEIIARIKAAKESNPKSMAAWADKANVGINTLKKYLPVIEGKTKIVESKRQRREVKSLIWEDGIPAVKGDDKHGVMSVRLASLPKVFKTADEEDVKGLHDFLFEHPEKPMLFIGNGGMMDHLGGLLYEMNRGVARCITPLDLASMSDATIKNSRCLIMSAGGRNMDIEYAVNRLKEVNPENTACYCHFLSEKSAFNDIPMRVFEFRKMGYVGEPFISIETKFYRDAILYRAFTGKRASEIGVSLSQKDCYQYRLNDSAGRLTPLKRIKSFVVLYSGYSAPAAHDFESVLAETGVAIANITDLRNFCHGRFIQLGNGTRHESKRPRHTKLESDTAAVLFITPRDKDLVNRVRKYAMSAETPVILIESKYNDSRAALDLIIKANVFLSDYEEKGLGINPCDPANYGSIDKRKPKSGIKFGSVVEAGMKYYDDTQAKILKLKQKIDGLLEIEHQNTERLKDNPSYLPCPTMDDIRKEERYDMSKHSCLAFRGKDDMWKDLWIPLGNMNGGFDYEMNGTLFPTSEQAYIAAGFSRNTPMHAEIQRILLNTNGYLAKHDVRDTYKGYWRKDWGEFNIDWMLYVVWQKVQNNQAFRDILMSIPKGITIIEDVSFKGKKKVDTDAFWGCRNEDKKAFGKMAREYAKSLNLKTDKATEDAENKLLWDYCNVGEYVGINAMGKILTIVKECLHDGTEPPIDYDLLNKKGIYLFGKKVLFNVEDAASIETEEAIPETPFTTPRAYAYPIDGKMVRGIMGGIIGDIVGSTREGYSSNETRAKFPLFEEKSHYTDDTAMTIAMADWVLHREEMTARDAMVKWYTGNEDRGFGGLFKAFIGTGQAQESTGNGAAMRVYPIAVSAKSLNEAVKLAEESAKVSHTTDVALNGAKAIAASIFIIKDGCAKGKSADDIKSEVRTHVEENYGYNLHQTMEDIVLQSMHLAWEKSKNKKDGTLFEDYIHMSNAGLTAKMAICAFLQGESYEDVVRRAVWMLGDSDSICCMAGCLAAQLYGIPKEIADTALSMLPEEMISVINEFDNNYPI